jgi:hypothetical protein
MPNPQHQGGLDPVQPATRSSVAAFASYLASATVSKGFRSSLRFAVRYWTEAETSRVRAIPRSLEHRVMPTSARKGGGHLS